jgi:D-threo-aldose 1-dehydrogenase
MQLNLPRLVFGTTTLGNLFVAPSDAEKHTLIAAWFKHAPPGPVVIDTAGKYGAGLALEVLGRELAALQVDPAQVVISNKLAWRRVPLKGTEPTFEPGAWVDLQHDAVQDISYEGILRCWADGRDLLGSYQAQLLSVHDPDEYLAAATSLHDRERRLDQIRDAYRALIELRDRGEAMAIGVGAKDWKVIRELDANCSLDWVMMANSFTIMNHPPELIAYIDSLASRNITVINSALMHGGFLTGGEYCDYRKLEPSNPVDAEKLRWRTLFHETCQKLHVDPFDVAVAFGRSHLGIRSVALSTSRADRVASLVASVQAEFPPAVWDELIKQGLIDPNYPYLL